jgi:hypothetical protein
MKEQFKFSELDRYAQETAVLDYYYGNEQKHVENNITIKDCYDLCLDQDDNLTYTKRGILIEDI